MISPYLLSRNKKDKEVYEMKLNDLENRVLRFSRFCHILPYNNEREEGHAFFHALNMEIVFLVGNWKDVIEDFQYGKTLQLIKEQSNLSVEEFDNLRNLVMILVENNMLVPLNYDEDKEIEKVCRDYLVGPTINLMYLVLTDQCNYGCSYCFVEGVMDENYKFSFMTPKMAKKRIDMFADWSSRTESKNKSLLFYGGEPLLNKQTFKEAVLYYNDLKRKEKLPKKADITLITNASLLDKKTAQFIKENGIAVGISIDGPPEVNNKARKFLHSNSGTFEATWRGYQNLVETGIKDVGISFTIGSHNIDDLLENAKYVVDRFQVKSLGFNILMDNEFKIFTNREYARQASDEIIKCFEYLRSEGIYEDRVMRKVESFINKNIYPSDCAACGRQFVALPSGEIGTCQAYTGTKKFFVKPYNGTTPFNSKTFQEWANRSPLSMPQCYDCIALGLCGGGCPCRAENRNGSIWAIDDIFCIHSKKTVEWMIEDYINS